MSSKTMSSLASCRIVALLALPLGAGADRSAGATI